MTQSNGGERDSTRLGLLIMALDDELRPTGYRWLLRRITADEFIRRHGRYFASITTSSVTDRDFKAYADTPVQALANVYKMWNDRLAKYERSTYDLGEK